MSWIFIEPIDVWLFRDGRPFSAGEEHMARSLFPPSPLTVQGLLRSLVLGSANVDWHDFRLQRSEAAQKLGEQIGHPSHLANGEIQPAALGQFAMAGPFLARRVDGRIQRITPLPADIMREKGTATYHLLQPRRDMALQANWPQTAMAPLWPPQDMDIESPGDEWLSEDNLRSYLNGQSFSTIESDHLVGAEPRLGISVNPWTGTARESLLYQAEFMRPRRDVGLLVDLKDDVRLPQPNGTTPFGGEARGAHYSTLSVDKVDAGASVAAPGKRLKIVLLTPAYFGSGWRPAHNDWSRFFNGTAVRLVAVALGQPQRLGGWDVARGEPKDMHAYVPAGSVYFFEADTLVSPPSVPFTETPMGELNLARLGFGQVAVGTWDWR